MCTVIIIIITIVIFTVKMAQARKEFVEDLKIFTTWFLLKFNSSISRAKNIGWHVDVNVNPNDCKCKCVLM